MTKRKVDGVLRASGLRCEHLVDPLGVDVRVPRLGWVVESEERHQIQTGYQILVDGRSAVFGGTSAVAPLWAGIVAGLNAGRGKPLGFVHASLYADASAFRDITSGDNKSGNIGFTAGAGWDPCTGLGSPAAALRKLFGAAT